MRRRRAKAEIMMHSKNAYHININCPDFMIENFFFATWNCTQRYFAKLWQTET